MNITKQFYERIDMSIYNELGIKKIINCWGTVTKIGGSKMEPEVLAAMNEAASAFVDILEFHEKAGQKIAEMLECEGACITSGASAGIAISTAACMTKGEIAKVLQLPDTTGMPNEVLMLKSHRILYDQAILLSGAKIREIGVTSFAIIEQITNILSEKTAMFFYVAENEKVRGSIKLSEIANILKNYNIPLVVDAAAELPPKSNIKKYLEQGADLVIFSGGKEIRGPQSSGLILGNKELIKACNANCCPNYSIGRSMKIDKETIGGIVKAVDLFIKKNYEREMERWESIVSRILSSLSKLPDIVIRRGFPVEPGIQPIDIPRVFIKPIYVHSKEVQKILMEFNPAICVDIQDDELVINPQCLEDSEIIFVIDSIKRVLIEKNKKKNEKDLVR